MRRLVLPLALLVLCALTTPARSASVPKLHLFSVNESGAPDLLPGRHVLIVAELRSDDLRAATLNAPTPAGLVLESYNASSGSLAAPDMTPGTLVPWVAWTGEVSSTQMVNISLWYYVPPNTAAGDRTIRVGGLSDGVTLAASTLIRVCCIEAPSPKQPGYRRLLPIIRR